MDASIQEKESVDSKVYEDTIVNASTRSKVANWVLRELRPVSFFLKRGPEAKHVRYGFVAQEVERILPGMVRDHNQRKYLVYQDLVAVLTLTAQAQWDRQTAQEKRLHEQKERMTSQAEHIEKLLRSVSMLNSRLRHWESRTPRRRMNGVV